MVAFRRTVSNGLRQIAFLLIPAAVVSAVLAEPIVRILYQRGAVPSAADTGRRGRARGVQRGSRLQRRDADDEPRLLQPAVELGADVDRSREPLPQRDPRCSSLPRRRVGHRARDRDLQCRGDGGAARPAPAADRPLRGSTDRDDGAEGHGRVDGSRRSSRGSSGIRSTRRSAIRSRRSSSRSGSGSPRRSPSISAPAGSSRCVRWTFCSRSARGCAAPDGSRRGSRPPSAEPSKNGLTSTIA